MQLWPEQEEECEREAERSAAGPAAAAANSKGLQASAGRPELLPRLLQLLRQEAGNFAWWEAGNTARWPVWPARTAAQGAQGLRPAAKTNATLLDLLPPPSLPEADSPGAS